MAYRAADGWGILSRGQGTQCLASGKPYMGRECRNDGEVCGCEADCGRVPVAIEEDMEGHKTHGDVSARGEE